MDNPIFEPHFSAEHLARKIDHLKTRINKLPVISIVKRRGIDFVRSKQEGSSGSYQEKRAGSKEGANLVMLAKEREQLNEQLNLAEHEWSRYYSKLPLQVPTDIYRILPVPECMTLSYYNNPPAVENPYPINTSYVFKGKTLRSRFEYIGVQAIDEMGLEFKNEIPIITPEGNYFLDIVIPVPERGRCVGFEFCGRIDDPKYINSIRNKITDYIGLGLVPWHDIIFIFGGETWIPPVQEIKNAIIFGIENC